MKFIADTAKIIGDVGLGDGVAVLYGAVLRADTGPIRIGNNSNVQDNCVVHTSPNEGCTIGEFVTVGHCAMVHSSVVGDRVVIGINATVLHSCEIGDDCIIAAGAVLRPGTKVPAGTLWGGVPAKQLRELTEEDKKNILLYAKEYEELVKNEGKERY
ncbi:MAG: gamma carbonic anhydrase family protein [Candidatus Diapherotrites archaeon]|nr:gamma carbonic anhydrase family protein [Candidatus Diapherotrites archaeon]